MVNGESFDWFKAQVDAATDEAAEPEDDDTEGRWADDGGNLTPIDNEAYRRDFPEVDEDDLFVEMEHGLY